METDVNVEAILAGIAAFSVLIAIGTAAYIVAAHAVAKAASKKDRNYWSFFILGLLLSPLTTALVVAAIPFRDDDPRNPRNRG